jgi:hypothetical protein
MATDPTPRPMSDGQRSYEQKRAAKAGMSLDKWMDAKAREKQAEQRAQAAAAKPPAKPGLLARLLDRAHRPLGKS